MKNCLKKNIIFISGIHGVGKTTLCKKISDKLFIKHYSASQLISNLSFKDKKVKNVIENQNKLLESVNEYLKDDEYYLLDGHFCLLNSNGEIIKVPLDTYKLLGLKAIIVVTDDEQEILKKLAHRDMKNYSIDMIKEFQKKEICYAQEVARDINVTIKIINVNSDIDEILSLIRNIIDK